MEKIRIRDMSETDLPQVHAIEGQFHDAPWSMSSFSYELDNCQSIMKIASYNGQVIGYVAIRSILDITHILKITVVPNYRKMGIGENLLRTSLTELQQTRPDIKNVTLEVRDSNSAAKNLYKKLGFRESGRRKEYYRNPSEDALIMSIEISGNKDFLQIYNKNKLDNFS